MKLTPHLSPFFWMIKFSRNANSTYVSINVSPQNVTYPSETPYASLISSIIGVIEIHVTELIAVAKQNEIRTRNLKSETRFT